MLLHNHLVELYPLLNIFVEYVLGNATEHNGIMHLGTHREIMNGMNDVFINLFVSITTRVHGELTFAPLHIVIIQLY